MTPSEVALRAASLISARGLAKGNLQNDDGEICHNGAVYLAITQEDSGKLMSLPQGEDMSLALEVFKRSTIVLRRRNMGNAPHVYNDDPDVSAEDVILLLKENAALDDDPEAMTLIEEYRQNGDFEAYKSPYLAWNVMSLVAPVYTNGSLTGFTLKLTTTGSAEKAQITEC